jgi:hypothetical protein
VLPVVCVQTCSTKTVKDTALTDHSSSENPLAVDNFSEGNILKRDFMQPISCTEMQRGFCTEALSHILDDVVNVDDPSAARDKGDSFYGF